MQTEQQILSQLNEHQKESVVYCDGPQLIIAGAGSGKTRVLTYKIAWLLTHYNMKPWNILALTFTNKAAKEMKERIAQLVGQQQAQQLQMGTFHSIFAHILRVEATAVGYGSDFTIYDETDSRSLLKNIVKEMGLDDSIYKPANVHSIISNAKNRLLDVNQFAVHYSNSSNTNHDLTDLPNIYLTYQQRLVQANAMDFDDLLFNTFLLLRDHPDVRAKYQQRYQYILVDEYQDTNFAQLQILQLLTEHNPHVCVVGDDYQSIYAFRGANIGNILNFNKTFSNAKLFKLEQNYRSTQNIVAAANSLMKHNRQQIAKNVFSRNDEGDKVVEWETISDKREATVVCHEIKRLMRAEGLHYSDFAILYRTNAQSRTFEEEMRKPEVGLGSHYQIYGGTSFYQRKEIKDVIAYFRLVVNPSDEEAFRRIINYPTRGIGNTTLQKIVVTAQRDNTSLWDVINHPGEHLLDVNKGTMTKLSNFTSLIDSFIQRLHTNNALQLAQSIIEQSGIKKDLAVDSTPEGEARRENIDSLISGIADFVDSQMEASLADHALLTDYLSTVSLLTDADNTDDSDDKIKLMTIHAAKGLEFNTVFVVGLEKNILPSIQAAEGNQLEEERRLLYVAITRAEKHCYLTWAHARWRYGKMDPFVEPSCFLDDIDPTFISKKSEGGSAMSQGRPWENDGHSRPWSDNFEIDQPYTGFHAWGDGYRKASNRMQNSRPVAGQFMADMKPKITGPHRREEAVNPFSQRMEEKLKSTGRWSRVSKAMANGGRLATSDASASSYSMANGQQLKVGNVIEHSRFGKGTVTAMTGTGENCKATVEFEETGTKQLLLKFSHFTIVG